MVALHLQHGVFVLNGRAEDSELSKAHSRTLTWSWEAGFSKYSTSAPTKRQIKCPITFCSNGAICILSNAPNSSRKKIPINSLSGQELNKCFELEYALQTHDMFTVWDAVIFSIAMSHSCSHILISVSHYYVSHNSNITVNLAALGKEIYVGSKTSSSQRSAHFASTSLWIDTNPTLCVIGNVQRSAKDLVCGLAKFVPALA